MPSVIANDLSPFGKYVPNGILAGILRATRRCSLSWRGKRVAFGKGTSAHGQLLYSLRAAGMTMDDVEPSYLQPSDAYAAFKQGQVDAWATWDPYTAQAQLESGARVIATGDGTANGYSFEVASNEALADARKQAAVADARTTVTRTNDRFKEIPDCIANTSV